MNEPMTGFDDEARAGLERRLALFEGKEQEALRALRAAAAIGDRERAQLQLEVVMSYADLQQGARKLIPAGARDDQETTYLVGSLFLYDCHRELIRGPNEHMHYVTGLKLGSILTMDRIISFGLDAATPVFAQGNLASSHEALIGLTRSGHRLHGLFHCHPGKGKEATRPSHIDLDTQERQERGKYPVIGAIFTEDGFVRFFSVSNQFHIVAYGDGVEHVGETVYRLTEIDQEQDPHQDEKGGVEHVGETAHRFTKIRQVHDRARRALGLR